MESSVLLTGLIMCAAFLSTALPSTVVADHEYELVVPLTWETTRLNVLVAGVDDPLVGQAIMDGIAVWEHGIAELAPEWLADSFELRVYFPARDPLPPEGWDPEDIHIYFVPQGFFAAGSSSGDNRSINWCIATAPLTHEHVTYGPHAMYRLAAHEFGHCLGLGHVFEHNVEYSPRFDLMGGGRDHACVSNLNVMGLELVFAGGEKPVTISMPSSEYFQVEC